LSSEPSSNVIAFTSAVPSRPNETLVVSSQTVTGGTLSTTVISKEQFDEFPLSSVDTIYIVCFPIATPDKVFVADGIPSILIVVAILFTGEQLSVTFIVDKV
jgi:hypothetical protein